MARRHADRLLEAPLERADLHALQASYRSERDEGVRKAIAIAFERAVQKSDETRELSASEFFYAGLGPGLADWDDLGFRRRDGSIDWDGYHRLERRWKYWNSRHGVWWRIKHGATHNHDPLRLHKLVTGKTTKRVDHAEEELRHHQALLDSLLAEHEPCPDPPGLERLPYRVRAYGELVGSVDGGAMDAALSRPMRRSS